MSSSPFTHGRRLLAGALLALGVALLAGCASSDTADETANWDAQRLYSEAKDAMSDGAYDRATKYFEKLESRYPYGTLAQQALIEAAYGHYRQDERQQALDACNRFLKIYPNNPDVDYVLYLKGRINFYANVGVIARLSKQNIYERDQHAAQDSYDAFKELATRFPNSKYTPDALLRMRYILNSLADYDAHVALFYYRRGAYVAAADRAQQGLHEHPDAPATELSLAVLMDSYDRLGLTQLRDDSARVLKTNYPQSPYLTQGLPEPENSWWQLW